ncbi:MAG TPA: ABC transporter permease, partial [Gemmatimonadaceae bacterium]|nr:ABC transporter permease [Gemmatimonadaceae bacterium]
MMTTDDRAPAWRRYLRFWRSSPAADVRDELSFHVQSMIDERVAAGLSPDAARAAVREQLGDVRRIEVTLSALSQQQERRMARVEWWETIRQDVVFGSRQLRKAPAFTVVAMLTLALGIGATSAIFSIVYSVLLRPLPYANADRVLTLSQVDGSNVKSVVPFGNYDTWRRESTGFEAMGAIWGGGPVVLTGMGDPAPIRNWWTSAGYWRVLFVPPAAGRYFTDAEDREGGPNVVVVSFALWRNRFSADRNAIGRVITLDGNPYTIVGVAPAAAVLDQPAERVWTPLAAPSSRLSDFGDHELRVYGLLKRGSAATTAIRQLTQIESSLARRHPHSGYDGHVAATPLADSLVGPHRATLYLLLGAVVLVLLVACGNIANLLLARANVRRTEIAVRSALGAIRSRIVSQLLVESLLLATGGGALGIVVAAAAMRFLVASPVRMPRLQEATLNAPVLAFAVGLAAVCAVIFGLVPAIRAARLDLQQTLRDGGRDSRGSGRDDLRRALVVSELCVAQILLIGAGLLIRSSLNIQSVAVGFDTHNLLAVDLRLPHARYDNDARVDATFEAIESGIAAIPGVRSAGRTQEAPIAGGGWDWTAFREG